MRLIDADELRKQWSTDDACEHDYTHLHFLESIDSAPTINQWIPVTERLPDEYGWYNVTKNIRGACFVMECWFALNDGWGSKDRDTITAWMPIPKPYRGE
jgi:hypothetical protein